MVKVAVRVGVNVRVWIRIFRQYIQQLRCIVSGGVSCTEVGVSCCIMGVTGQLQENWKLLCGV